jgi:thioredoxin 1
MSSHDLRTVSDSNFDAEVIRAARPVLVKFEADWCGPCKAMKPAIEQIADEYQDRVTVATLDIDQNAQTPHRFGVRSIPTVMLFVDGKVAAQRVGLIRKPELSALLEAGLGVSA